MANSAFDFSALTLNGEHQPLDRYAGQVALIVNVASYCGFTPQYAGLQALYERYRDQGFTVLAFPCNQFGAQEPGSAAAIREFCSTEYAITFPLFAKIDVNGAGTQPLFSWLKEQQPGLMGSTAIKWNFTKFLVGRDGRVLSRHAPATSPDALRGAIDAALATTPPPLP